MKPEKATIAIMVRGKSPVISPRPTDCLPISSPEPSIIALARSLGRQYSRVHADVVALQAVGLVERNKGALRAAADRIMADIRL